MTFESQVQSQNADCEPQLIRSEIAVLLSFLKPGSEVPPRTIGLVVDGTTESMEWYRQVNQIWLSQGNLGSLFPVRSILNPGEFELLRQPPDYMLTHLSLLSIRELHLVFAKVYQLLAPNGGIVVGFVDHHSEGKGGHRRLATFSVHKVLFELTRVGFQDMAIRQTDFHAGYPNEEPRLKNGFGEGAFVVIRAFKRRSERQVGAYDSLAK